MTESSDGKRRSARHERTEIDAHRPAAEPRTVVEAIAIVPGMRIEQYEVIREIGRGGMGQVFLARDTRLGRRVAMKFLASRSKQFTERFLVEARATARCAHEHIVVIHDVDELAGLPYMVFEYVEGVSLGALMADKRMPVGRAIELIVPVVKALACAHAANIVHRDLKPENVIVTASGTVKVLDFGIAKLFSTPDPASPRSRSPSPGTPLTETRAGAIVGTLPYMSPEQLGTDEVDHRSDLWAVGIMLFEMLAGQHPLEPVTQGKLFGAAAALDTPLPSLADEVADLPDRLVRVVARCLAKHKTERYATAEELLADLEPLLPSRAGRSLVADDSPYPGLTSFQEADANRFFGRSADIAAVVAKLRDQPLLGVVGPSGVGKSSLVRAGVASALKSSGESWEVIIVRPGRQPLASLAGALEALRDSRDSDPIVSEDPVQRLRAEPGTFGARLRARARRRRTQILLFVDQHEELYTLVPDADELRAFTACLAGAADDPSGPLRAIVAMRSDFLDRAAEDRRFVEELSRGLVFLQPPSRAGLEQALVQPLDMLGYTFEPGVVAAMLETLSATPGPLPLLQFTAARLWDQRDRTRRVLTAASYEAMGGVGGALATHADEVLAGLSAQDQHLVRAMCQRLVTPERTRAIVDATELRDISPDIDRIISLLVAARLLVVHAQREGGSAAVELVHESLIKTWPALRRWLDETQEDAAFVAQLRTAAKQWDQKGRVQGLLWRNEAMEEARLWWSRAPRKLAPREQDFLDAVLALGTRSARLRRRLVIGAFAVLCAVLAAGSIALVQIRDAEQIARDNADRAETAKAQAEAATAQAEAATAQAKLVNHQLQVQAQQLIVEKQTADTKTAEAQASEAREANALREIQDQKSAIHNAGVALSRAHQQTQQEELANKKLKHTGQITTDLK